LNPGKSSQESAKIYRASKSYKLNRLYFYTSQHLAVSLALTGVIVALLTSSFSLSMASFQDFSILKDKVLGVYDLSRKVTMVQSSFNFYASFKNETGSYKILHQDALAQAMKFAQYLNEASNLLLSIVKDENSKFEDAIVDEILYTNPCKHVDDDLKDFCLVSNNQNSFGLLGLNHKLYQILAPLPEAFNENITFADAYKAMDKVSAAIGNVHLVTFSAYAHLGQHYVDLFSQAVDNSITSKLHKFLLNLSLTLVCLAWMRVVVLSAFKSLDVTMRTILKLIPKRIFEENKIIKHYLGPGFRKELEIIDGLN